MNEVANKRNRLTQSILERYAELPESEKSAMLAVIKLMPSAPDGNRLLEQALEDGIESWSDALRYFDCPDAGAEL